MAKFVIAGSADCPYFAKIELLADSLAKNLPDFKLHKIVKQPYDWEDWLSSTCSERGWEHGKSPIVWRELVDRGGKGLLIGGANEFQEYAQGYYGLKSAFTSSDMVKMAAENLKTKTEIDEEERQFRETVKPIHICITQASNPISYNMMESIAKGEVLGEDTQISVRFLDTSENTDILEGLKMETYDLACPMLRDISITTDHAAAFADCSVIVLLDEVEKEPEESKADWLIRNREHFLKYAKAINDNARKDVKVILGGRGPVNFNAFMMLEEMPDIPAQNVVAMSRMLENHAKSIISQRLNVNSASVVDVVVWGHSSDKYYLDTTKSRVHNYDGAIWGPPSFSLPVGEMVHDDKWLQGEFLEVLEKRRETVESALDHRATASHAAAVSSLLAHWWGGSPNGQLFSLGVQSEGWYGVPDGLFFSYPVTFDSSGKWTVVPDLEISDESREKIEETIQDLISEKEVIYPPPHVPTPTPEPEPSPTPPTAEEISADQDGSTAPDDGQNLTAISEDREGEAQAESEMTRTTPEETSPRSEKDEQQSET